MDTPPIRESEVLKENEPMLRVFEKLRFPIETPSAGECDSATSSESR